MGAAETLVGPHPAVLLLARSRLPPSMAPPLVATLPRTQVAPPTSAYE
jgi:hypothetical protein